MGSIKHILVGTDFSDPAAVALELARVQACALGAKLTLLHAYSPALDLLDPVGIDPSRFEIGHEIHEALGRLKDRVMGAVDEVAVDVVAGEHPVEVICAYAREHAVDLIVVGAHGRSGVREMLIGSTAERVARHASCSVMLAR